MLDTETTGLIENVTVKDKMLPEVIDFYGCVLDVDTGKIEDELDILIKPTIAKKLPEEIVNITHITDDMLKGKEQFKHWHMPIRDIIERSPCAAAHNAAYDKEVLDVEYNRLSQTIGWPRVICTVEQTMHLKGYRLSLSALHELLFNETFVDAHRAKTDVQALCRCIVELIKREEIIYAVA